MPLIKSNVVTKLKRKPVDSSQLNRGDVLDIISGQSLAVYTLEPANNGHSKVTLDLAGWKEGYIFNQHWNIPDKIEKNLGFVKQIQPKGIIRKVVKSLKDYVMQPDQNTCQSAAIATITGGDVWAIRNELTARGSAGDPYNMGRYLEERVSEYQFKPNASLNDMLRGIDAGYELITHGYFTGSGHVLRVIGYEADPETGSYALLCDDSWYKFKPKYWTYADWDTSGNNVKYSSYCMYAACIAGQSVDDAARIYNQGILDSNQGNAWLHLVKR